MSTFSRGHGKERLLVVDDAADTVEVIRRNLTQSGYEVLTARSVAEAVTRLEETRVDLVITDLKMPGASGLELVRLVREGFRDTAVMMITGYATIEGAVEAVKIGAEEYLAKPFTQEELLGTVGKAMAKVRARKAQHALLAPSDDLLGLLGSSEAMNGVSATVRKAAAGQVPVFIQGERGTGKASLARAIHYRGPRAARAFVQVTCGSAPEELLDRELFGEAIAPPAADEGAWKGLLAAVEGGTLYLNEVSGLSHALQGKLLRALRDKETAVGSVRKSHEPDVRLIASSTRDLAPLLERSLFREELFYRLSALTIQVPPLRERGEDAVGLTRHFVERFSARLGRTPPRMSDQALVLLRDYAWPGNVAELEDALWRTLATLDGEIIDAHHIPASVRLAVGSRGGLLRPLHEVEAEHIGNVLTSLQGNKTRAAEILGIDRRTLREKLKARDARR
jgi:two-component system response regulator HydG